MGADQSPHAATEGLGTGDITTFIHSSQRSLLITEALGKATRKP